MIGLFLLLVIIPFIIVCFNHHKQKKWQLLHQEPPGPPGLPLIGNLHQFLNNITTSSTTPHEYLYKLSKKYGPIMSMRFGSVPVLVISSANAAEQALKTQDLAFSGRPASISAQKFSYNGLDFAFRSYGQYWKEMRKISVLHLFSTKRVQSFRHVREDEVSTLIKEIQEEAAKNSVINLSEMVMSLTRSLICRICFGKRVQEMESDDEEHKKKRRRRFKKLFLESQEMFAGIFFSDYFPWFGYPLDKFRGMIGKLEKNVREFDHFYQEIIDEHLKQQEDSAAEGNHKDDNVIDILLKLRAEKSTPFDLSFDHIKALLMVRIIYIYILVPFCII